MFEDSPRLRRHLTGSTNDESSIRINLRHMSIYLGWSGSVARLGNKPIRTLILDELDKYQDSRNEASSEALAEHRTTTWSGPMPYCQNIHADNGNRSHMGCVH